MALSDERILNAHFRIAPSEELAMRGEYNSIDREGGISEREAAGGVTVKLDNTHEVELGASYTYAEGKTVTVSDDGNGSRTDLGIKFTRTDYGGNKLYVFGQATLQRDTGRERNDRVGGGMESNLAHNITANLEASWGTSGLGLLGGFSYEPTVSDRYYMGYRLTPDTATGDLNSYDPFGRDNGELIVGQHRRLSDTLTAWTEHNFDLTGANQGLLQTYGIEYTPDPVWVLSGGLEAGVISDDVTGEFERFAPSMAVSYNEDGQKFGARLEARFETSDDGLRDRTTWLATGHSVMQYDDNWRFLSSVDAVISQSDQTTINNADYLEGSIGWAFRPIENDRLNALFKYTYLHDLPANGQIDANGLSAQPMQRSHILSADFIYDLNQNLSVGAKYGFRIGEISTNRLGDDFVKNSAHLVIGRADWHVVKNWDLMLEGRALWLPELEQIQWGAVAAVYRHIDDKFKIGVGYNFGRFSDDLSDVTLDDQGVFVNVIGKL